MYGSAFVHIQHSLFARPFGLELETFLDMIAS